MNHCKISIDQFIDGRTKDWTGLPPGCNEEEIRSAYIFNEGEGVIYLGDEVSRYTFRVLNHPGFEQGINFCFTGGKLALIFAEQSSFILRQGKEISNTLGQPAFRTDFYWRDEIVANGEYVYHAKGITLCIIPETGMLVKIIGYAPCSARNYLQKYYHSQLAREF